MKIKNHQLEKIKKVMKYLYLVNIKINLNQSIIINKYKIDNLEIFRDENNYDILLNKYNFNFYCFKIFKI